jgi:hypothetical protein
MGDFSISPLEMLLDSQRKGYLGLHVEQGVPILDRDLNLLQDLLFAGVRSLFARYVGAGVPPDSDSFAIQALPAAQADQNFRIAAGDGPAVVGGIEVSNPDPANYRDQAGVPPLTAPSAAQPDPRVDTVYLDVFLVEEDGTNDTTLANSLDVGMRTSVRVKPAWTVRVAEGQPTPTPPGGHGFYELAELRRRRLNPTIDATMITDTRHRLLTVADLERRVSLLERVLLLPAFGRPAFTPPSGRISQTITLSGTNFTVGGASSVTVLFGTRPAELVGTPSATQLQARVPVDVVPAASTVVDVPITVRTAGGAVVSEDTFRAARDVPKPTFAVPPFSPPNGTAGDTVALSGDNFNWPPLSVKFDTANADLVGTPTHTLVRVRVPAGLATPGSFRDVPITVTTGGGAVTSTSLFRVNG